MLNKNLQACQTPPARPKMRRLPDLVRDTRLETRISGDVTTHAYQVSDITNRRRITIKEVQWRRDRQIGGGGFGDVYVESQELPGSVEQNQVRAVKRIRHGTHQKYIHELEAIAKFSHSKVRCGRKNARIWSDIHIV